MEAFQVLSRGGAKFDKNRFKADVGLFNDSKSKTKLYNTNIPQETSNNNVPLELDFFKYAQRNSLPKRSADAQSDSPELKRRKLLHSEDELMAEPKHEQDAPILKESISAAPSIKHRVVTKGSNIPSPIESFEELKSRYQIPPHLFNNISKSGYGHPTSIQSHAIPILLESRDVAAISPTGTGKTLTYLFPIFSALGAPASSTKNGAGPGVRAVIIAPTRELAHQIHNECLKLAQGRKWRIVLFSKATASTLADKVARSNVDIIISTPLRLLASLQSGDLELDGVRHVVLDEADRMLDVEFVDQVQELLAFCTYPNIQKAVFSATLPAGAEKLAMDMLNNPIRIVVGLKDTPLPLIQQSLTYVADDQSKLPSLLAHLAKPYHPPILVFTSSQARATSLSEELVLNGIPNVDCLHAGLTKKEREDTINRMLDGECWVMVSTEVMARGMDFKGVREVINYDFPTSVQSYVHRIGRTGRAGREGTAITYFTDDDMPYIKSIANVILQSGFSVPEWMIKLPKPSKMKRRTMGKVKRPETVNPARYVGRRDSIKKRDMIAGSKRRFSKNEERS